MAIEDESLARLLRGLLDKVGLDLEDARAMLRATQGRVQELETEQAGLALALKRYNGQPRAHSQASAGTAARSTSSAEPPTGLHPELGAPKAEMSHTERARKALEELGRPASTQEVRDKAAIGDPKFTPEQARNALVYLSRRKKQVKHLPSGLWELVVADGAPPGDGPTPVVMAGANGASEGSPIIAGVTVPANGFGSL